MRTDRGGGDQQQFYPRDQSNRDQRDRGDNLFNSYGRGGRDSDTFRSGGRESRGEGFRAQSRSPPQR